MGLGLTMAMAKGEEELVVPKITKLKNLHITTRLIVDGRANVTIIAPASGVYAKDAAAIAAAVEKRSGVRPPIASDAAPEGAVPIGGNLIVLGNRSTSTTIEELYNRYFTLLDLRYPGPKGHVVRTLHDPFGDGHNVVFVGGSDADGVKAASKQLIRRLTEADARPGGLSIGWIADIKCDHGITVAAAEADIREIPMWECSDGYKNTGFFGWNSLSKNMALYYLTGEKAYVRRFLWLAFPGDDAEAKKELLRVEKLAIRQRNPEDPLACFYHYRAHLMILYWDLMLRRPCSRAAIRSRCSSALRSTTCIKPPTCSATADGSAMAGESGGRTRASFALGSRSGPTSACGPPRRRTPLSASGASTMCLSANGSIGPRACPWRSRSLMGAFARVWTPAAIMSLSTVCRRTAGLSITRMRSMSFASTVTRYWAEGQPIISTRHACVWTGWSAQRSPETRG